jgi:hypothetical protein
MNSLLRLIAITAILTLGHGIAHADATNPEEAYRPATVPTLYNTLYVPDGFDSNDNTQVVAEGMFSNACYRPANPNVKVDSSKKTISIGPVAYKFNGFCLQIILPYDRVIDLGMVPSGQYKLIQEANGQELGQINIKPATNLAADDFLYASISQAFYYSENGKNQVVLTGDFPNSCMKMQEVRIELQSKVIVIQPIADMQAGSNCTGGKFPFRQVVELKSVHAGRYLLHVRSLNGRAVNTLIDVK